MFRTILPPVLALVLSFAAWSPARALGPTDILGLPGVYITGSAGGGTLEDFDIREQSTANVFRADPLAGYSLSGAAGLDFGIIRLEGEVFYNDNELDSFGGFFGTFDGTVETLAGMGNIFLDIPTGIGITPFIGGGIGYADVEADISSGFANLVNDSDGVLAWQLRAGIAFAIFPYTDLTLGYRYFVTEDLDMQNATGSVEVEGLRTHIGEIGLRFTF